MLAGCGFLLVTPETVRPPEERHRYRPQRVMVAVASRGTFFAAGAAVAVGAQRADRAARLLRAGGRGHRRGGQEAAGAAPGLARAGAPFGGWLKAFISQDQRAAGQVEEPGFVRFINSLMMSLN